MQVVACSLMTCLLHQVSWVKEAGTTSEGFAAPTALCSSG